jgi:hypothetical protein
MTPIFHVANDPVNFIDPDGWDVSWWLPFVTSLMRFTGNITDWNQLQNLDQLSIDWPDEYVEQAGVAGGDSPEIITVGSRWIIIILL